MAYRIGLSGSIINEIMNFFPSYPFRNRLPLSSYLWGLSRVVGSKWGLKKEWIWFSGLCPLPIMWSVSPWKGRELLIDGRGITGFFGSMVGKLSDWQRIDRQAALHAETIEEIRVEISESSPLRPYISSLSLAKKVWQLKVTSWPCTKPRWIDCPLLPFHGITTGG